MPWWGWLIAGIGLLAVEMFLIDAQFYLVFLGASAALVGVLGLAGLAMPEWGEWLTFAALAIVAMITFRRRMYELVRRQQGPVQERITAGDRVVVPTRLEPGQSCRIDYRGSSWTARNAGGSTIEAGSEARISHVDGLTLQLTTAA
jgi:membrane protein implicated in regulation of membrane protease activity